MNDEEMKQLGETLIGISKGEDFEILDEGVWKSTWLHPLVFIKEDIKIRIKPKTITVNGVDVPVPMREKPQYGDQYYIADITAGSLYFQLSWEDDPADDIWIKRGLVHTTKEAAIAHSKAMIANNQPK